MANADTLQLTLPCVLRAKFATDDSPRIDALFYGSSDSEALEHMERIALHETFGRDWDPEIHGDPFFYSECNAPRPRNSFFLQWINNPSFIDMRVPASRCPRFANTTEDSESDDDDDESHIDRALDKNFLGQIAVWSSDESGNLTLACLYKCMYAHLSVSDLLRKRTESDIALESGKVPQYKEIGQ